MTTSYCHKSYSPVSHPAKEAFRSTEILPVCICQGDVFLTEVTGVQINCSSAINPGNLFISCGFLKLSGGLEILLLCTLKSKIHPAVKIPL